MYAGKVDVPVLRVIKDKRYSEPERILSECSRAGAVASIFVQSKNLMAENYCSGLLIPSSSAQYRFHNLVEAGRPAVLRVSDQRWMWYEIHQDSRGKEIWRWRISSVDSRLTRDVDDGKPQSSPSVGFKSEPALPDPKHLGKEMMQNPI